MISNYKIKYFTSLNINIQNKLKRRFILHKGSGMSNILDDISRLNGAAIAFSKSGRIIGWSCIEDNGINNLYPSWISTFVSKRYRHNGIAKNLIKNIIENNKNKKYLLFNWNRYKFVPINQVLNIG